MKPKTGSGYFSGQLEYEFRDNTATLTPKNATSDILRIIEVWGLAYYNWLIQAHSVDEIVFDLTTISVNEHQLESFKRRISYLNLNNPFTLDIKYHESITLYTKNEILNRPSNEVITSDFDQRSNDDEPGRLETDFQVFLNGGSILKSESFDTEDYYLAYRRLALLGKDFFNLKNNYRVIRELPTGVYKNIKSESNRLLPTYLVDFATFNKDSELSFIEIKLNDIKLHVLSQLLDYALFALSYKNQIIDLVQNHLGKDFCPRGIDKKPITCYIANNRFHPRFDEIAKYYSPEPKGFNMKFKKLVFGQTTSI